MKVLDKRGQERGLVTLESLGPGEVFVVPDWGVDVVLIMTDCPLGDDSVAAGCDDYLQRYFINTYGRRYSGYRPDTLVRVLNATLILEDDGKASE